jgi:hypothetical protein
MKGNNSAINFYDVDQTIKNESDLTNLVVEHYRERKPLKNVTALLFQHQLTNHVPQTKALIDLGLDPRKIYWVDIPYTSHKSIRKAVQASEAERPEKHPINPEAAEWLTNEFYRLVGNKTNWLPEKNDVISEIRSQE